MYKINSFGPYAKRTRVALSRTYADLADAVADMPSTGVVYDARTLHIHAFAASQEQAVTLLASLRLDQGWPASECLKLSVSE